MQVRPTLLPLTPKLRPLDEARPAGIAVPPAPAMRLDAAPTASNDRRVRERIGEAIGGAFYASLIRQMQKTTFKTPLMHGGRGEEVFNGQLVQELARKMGTAAGNPLTERFFTAMKKRRPVAPTSEGAAA